MDIKINPPTINDKGQVVIDRIKEVEIEKIVEIEKPVERIIEKPVIVETEKIVQVKEVHTDALYEQLSYLNARNEELKQLIKTTLDQIKYVASDPNKFKALQKDLDTKLESFKGHVDSIKPDFYRNIESLRKELISITNKLESQKPDNNKNYDSNFELLNKLLQGMRGELVEITKIQDVISYLNIVKKSIDGLNINPKVSVTTQVIEDKNTQESLRLQTEEFKALREDQKSKLLEIIPKLDSVKASVESNLHSITKSVSDIEKVLEQVEVSIPDSVKQAMGEIGVDSIVTESMEYIVRDFQDNLSKELSKTISLIKKSLQESKEGFEKSFDTIMNQKVFDLTIDIQKSISLIVRDELNSYLSSFKVQVDVPDNTLSLINIIQRTISDSLKQEPIKYIVNKVEDLPVNTNYLGRIVIVRYVSFIKRNKPYIFDGETWSQL